MTQNNLGNALSNLGEFASESTQLENAVEAYREALKEHTRERVPLDWAMTQNNLADALAALVRKRTAPHDSTRRSRPIARRSRNARGNAGRSTGPRAPATAASR